MGLVSVWPGNDGIGFSVARLGIGFSAAQMGLVSVLARES